MPPVLGVLPVDRNEYAEKSLIAIRNKILEFEFEERLAQRFLTSFAKDKQTVLRIENQLGAIQKKLKEFAIEEEMWIDVLKELNS